MNYALPDDHVPGNPASRARKAVEAATIKVSPKGGAVDILRLCAICDGAEPHTPASDCFCSRRARRNARSVCLTPPL